MDILNKSKIALFLLGFLLFCDRPISAEEIRVGALLPLTGDYAQYGQELLRGVQLGAEEGPPGDTIRIFAEDSGTMNTGTSSSAATKLVDINKVHALVVLGADDVNPLVGLGKRSGVPIISLWDNSAALAKLGDFIFSNGFSLEGAASLYATFASEDLGATRAAVISNQSSWSSTITEAFKSKFKEQGGTLVFQEAVPDDFKDFRSTVLKLSQQKPEIVFLPLSLPSTLLEAVRKLRAMGLAVPIVASEALVGDTMTALGAQSEGIYVGWLPSAPLEISKRYRERYGRPPEDPGIVEIGFSGLRRIVEARTKNPAASLRESLNLLFGPSRRTDRQYMLYQVQSGKLVPIKSMRYKREGGK
jgi:ABC-type branched-subunit amino acid transport system substrate-binding protein